MAENTAIEWTDHTFNPWWGCTKVSPGCTNCYADALDRRTGGAHWGPKADRRLTKPQNWNQPRKWNSQAQQQGRRFRVFCASMADVFDDHPSILPEWRDALWRLIEETLHLDWLLLTKRPQDIMRLIPERWRDGLPANVWVGASVVNQQEADTNIPHLLRVPARIRFLSMEPLLGPVTLVLSGLPGWDEDWKLCALTGQEWAGRGFDETAPSMETRIHWVICGGESGPGARPMHPDWARSLRDQCAAAGVPFLFKQWGEWGPAIGMAVTHRWRGDTLAPFDGGKVEGTGMRRMGKKKAGRLLDGRTWDQFPKAGAT